MTKKTFSTVLLCSIICAITLLINNFSTFAQYPDTSKYIPQITLGASNGFGPYFLGKPQQNSFSVSDLPEHTSQIVFRFIDADSVPVGNPYIVNGTDIQSATWNVSLDTLGIPLSPQFTLHLNYKNDSTADYYVAYSVYPDTIAFSASAGWGPFITNNYAFADTSWHPVPQQSNTFTVSHLPPRTRRALFQVLEADSTVVDSLWVNATQGQFLQSAEFPYVRMDELPLSTRYLRVTLYCHGSSNNGLEYHKMLQVVPQSPLLTTKSMGSVLTDSIPVFIENPGGGQALAVDSIRHAQITNGPGTQMFEWFSGPYSLDPIAGEWSVESWLRVDLDDITQFAENEEDFIYVDSVFAISFLSYYGGTSSGFRLYSLVNLGYYELYEAQFDNSLLEGNEWHHFAFCLDGQYNNIHQFYLDGEPISTSVNQENITYIEQNFPNYDHLLRTKPLILGGWAGDQHSYVTGFDEVRIWHSCRTEEEIVQNMHSTVLQDYFLRGYWNFDDLRNRLGVISDLSCSNNSGALENGASFIPEYTGLFDIKDTFEIRSSDAATDSVKFVFLNEDKKVLDSAVIATTNGKTVWTYDISTLPFTTTHLLVSEISQDNPSGFQTLYNVHASAPAPIATPLCNWGTYYHSDEGPGSITNTVRVTSFPDNTSKVELGLKKGDTLYNAESYDLNSVPYQYNLTLNGTDNYIKTSSQMAAPHNIQLSLWFLTTSAKGGRLIGFCDNPDGVNCTKYDRDLFLEKNGALRFHFRYNGEDQILYGSNTYNDGAWHCVTVSMSEYLGTGLYVDGSLVDQTDLYADDVFDGYWVIGRTDVSGAVLKSRLGEYFQGSLAYINFDEMNDKQGRVPDKNLMNGASRGVMLYKLDEGSGTVIHDSQGTNNATLEGSEQKWFRTGKLSSVRWEHNMIDKSQGTYTFYAKVYYAGGGEEGVYYPLGNFNIEEPVPDFSFGYSFTQGLGYFNEGEQLYNELEFETDYTGESDPDWKENFVQYQIISPQHIIIDQNYITWDVTGYTNKLVMDMGDAPPGSYVNVQIGYFTNDNFQQVSYHFSTPLLIRPMLAPELSGDFGPFVQAIAPGTMARDNTYSIFTEGLSDLSRVTAKFFDINGTEIASVDGVNVDDTTWHITQNMAALSPPETDMKVYYYLGSDEFLAKVAGPYKILIHKTRPDWFDFISDDKFSNVVEQGDSVTFEISSPFESSYVINNSENVTIPNWVPLIGNTGSEMDMPTATAYLKFMKSESKLELNEPPEFFQKVFNLGAGKPSTLSVGFNYSQNNTYSLDANNNLLATQNFSMGGSLTSGFNKLENIVKRLKEIVEAVKVADPETIIVSPSFELTYTGSFEYASRLRLMIDTTTGKWGSYGNLDVDANPDHESAFKNSTSYHFYSGAAEMEFGIGAELLEGLVSAHFGVSGRFVLGFGHSYVTIPSYKEKFLKSFAFQTYGRFYVDVLWGWYEKTVWGPKMFYSANIWGDDMRNCFPPAKKGANGLAGRDDEEYSSPLVVDFQPVSAYSRSPLPIPQSGIMTSSKHLRIDWLERGNAFGERKLQSQWFDVEKHSFLASKTVETNDHALHSPMSADPDETLVIHAWTQSRHTSSDFAGDDPLTEFAKSLDIWYAVYDRAKDSVVCKSMLEDEMLTFTDGRAEGKPQLVMLSPTKALITWQVADLDVHKSDIWYTFLEKDGDTWNQGPLMTAIEGDGVETHIKLVSPSENEAILVWLNTDRDNLQTTVRSASFDGSSWSATETVSGVYDIYCNYMDVGFKNGTGGLVYTVFVEDQVNGNHEKLKLIPWSDGHFRPEQAVELMVDSTEHFQLPVLAISDGAKAVIAVKKERMSPKDIFHKICQVDLLKGDLNTPGATWDHVAANPYVCDTTKQVSELSLAFAGGDTLMLLSQEYPVSGVNTPFVPQNGVMFGDPVMNLVLRSFILGDDATITDVDEHQYFLDIPELGKSPDTFTRVQCYPNPCSDHATLIFGLSRRTEVHIDLLDMQGMIRAHLLEEILPAGSYNLNLNTTTLVAGTYILRLQNSDSVRSVKIVVAN